MSNLLRVISSLVLGAPDRAQGPDLSHWDGIFIPENAKRRIDFAIQKITEGTDGIDPDIDTIWRGVQDVDIRGAYHYQRSGMSWEKQANHFIQVASEYSFHFFALDVETLNNTLNNTFFADVRRIIDHWRYLMPSKPVVLYTNNDVYKQLYYAFKRLYPSDGVEWLENVPLWYSWPTSIFNEPLLPAMRKTWTFWQWSFSGTKADWGTNAATDLNVFNGSVDELREWLGMGPEVPDVPEEPNVPDVPATEPVPEQTLFDAEVLPSMKMVVRTQPIISTSTDTMMRVYAGDRFQGHIWAGEDYLWMQISATNNMPALIGKWVAVRKLDGSEKFIKLTIPQPVNVNIPQVWRVKHDKELGPLWRPNLPEVHPFFPNHYSVFGEKWQLLSRAMNARISDNKWTVVYNYKLWITNKQGFAKPGDPRANYVLRTNLKCEPPKVEALTTGGSFHTGTIEGNNLVVETLDVNNPPTLDWIMQRPWLWVYAVTVDKNGTPRRFPEGLQPNGEVVPIIHPLIADPHRYGKITFPLSKLEKWDMTKPLPDPFKLYL